MRSICPVIEPARSAPPAVAARSASRARTASGVFRPWTRHGHGYWGQAQTRDRWRKAFGARGFDVTEVGTGPAILYWLVTRR